MADQVKGTAKISAEMYEGDSEVLLVFSMQDNADAVALFDLIQEQIPLGGISIGPAKFSATAIISVEDGASKSRIFEALYAMRSSLDLPEPKIVDVMVCKLRKKLDALGVEIETIWGWGYRLSPASREALAELRRAVS